MVNSLSERIIWYGQHPHHKGAAAQPNLGNQRDYQSLNQYCMRSVGFM